MTYEQHGSEPHDDDVHDETPTEEENPTRSTESSDGVGEEKSKVGRPSKYSLELQDAICASLAAGMSVEKAVERVGIGTSAYYAWIAKGKRAEQRDDLDQLDEEERCSLRFLWAVQAAKAESVGVLERVVFDAARAEKVRRSVRTRTQLTNRTGIVCDDDGNPVWIESTRVEVIERPNVTAALALLKYRAGEEAVEELGLLRFGSPYKFETDKEKRARLVAERDRRAKAAEEERDQ